MTTDPALPPEDPAVELLAEAFKARWPGWFTGNKPWREEAEALLAASPRLRAALAGPPAVDLYARIDGLERALTLLVIEATEYTPVMPGLKEARAVLADGSVGAAPPVVQADLEPNTGETSGAPVSLGAAPPEPPAPDPRPFGEVLAAVRKGTGMTLRELASRAGADFTYLSKIENGHERPGRDLVVRLDKELFAEHALIEAFDTLPCLRCGLRVAPPRRADQ